jgi:Ca2+-binding RTX toxin-like protein
MASTTYGVPSGTQLTAYTGPMTITTPGTVIDGKIINGSLRILADNVVIKNCVINFNSYWGIDAYGYKNTTVQDCTITGPGYAGSSDSAIAGTGNFLRNDISKVQNGITLNNGSSIVQGNYIHDLECAGSDPHYDGIQVFGGQHQVLIADNTIISRDTSNILISDLWGAVSDITIRDNFLGGTSGYNIYVTGDHGNGTTGVTIENNQIARGFYGYYYIYQANPTIRSNTELPQGTLPTGTGGNATVFNGTAGNDVLPPDSSSMAGSQTLRGLDGNDVLRGGVGADVLDGGNGSDTASYAGSTAGVTVNLQTGQALNGDAQGDRLVSIENLTGSGYADRLTGNAAANVLNGGVGADTMRGGAGNDFYVVDSANDTIDEGVSGSNGVDLVQSSVSFSLATSARVLGAFEHLTLTGTGNVSGTGNPWNNAIAGNSGANTLSGGGGNDILNGRAGNDILSGGAGNDTMRGGAGNDVYIVDSASDTVDESAAGSRGTDTVQSSVSFSLVSSARVLGSLENLTLTGSVNLSGSGNDLANVLNGNAGSNVLSGAAGNDTMRGGAGNDVLRGGAGNDILTGGTGRDTFVFGTLLAASTNVDTITDFSVVDDVVHLENAVFTALIGTGVLSSANFVKNTTGLAADANDYVVYETDTGKLFYDSNGSAAGGSIHFGTLTPNLNLTSADFSVI